MKLKKLIDGIPFDAIKGSKEIEITGISSDSRTVAFGNLFIAKKGDKHHGGEFVSQAVQNGAAAVVCDLYHPLLSKATQLICPSPEKFEALLADRLFEHPSRKLFIAGVTGTKGKTTTTYLLKHLLDAKQMPSGLIGTVETIAGRRRMPSTHTTHDVSLNHKWLAEIANEKGKAAVLEVSSHGLIQGRVDQIQFDAALFTNLIPDHLDFHGNMEAYAKAKRELFRLLNQSSKENKCAIANADDPMADFMLEGCLAHRLSFGLSPKADLRAEEISLNAGQTSFVARYRQESARFLIPLIGRFNVCNVLGAAAVGLHLGFSLEEMAGIFRRFETVPGRLERVPNQRGLHIFIDYAHVGDALDQVLQTLRETTRGRIITVFGAGGNRDPGRRPALAKAADRGSDLSIVTSDNPRSEDPEEICRQILAGFSSLKAVRVQLDRKKAIAEAIAAAKCGDIVLIAGKGHERTQIFAHQTVPFDDRDAVREALCELQPR